MTTCSPVSRSEECLPSSPLQSQLARGCEAEPGCSKIELQDLADCVTRLIADLKEDESSCEKDCSSDKRGFEQPPTLSLKVENLNCVQLPSSASINACGISAAPNGVVADVSENPCSISAASNGAIASSVTNPVVPPTSTTRADAGAFSLIAPAPTRSSTAQLNAGELSPAAPSPTITGAEQLSRTHAWTGVSQEMWNEINAQRNVFGDRMDSQSRINSIPNKGTVLYPADVENINSALKESDVVILKGGVYNIKETIVLNGKTLIGAEGETVVINGSQVRSRSPNDGLGVAIKMGDNSNLKNINLEDADNQGIVAGNNNNLYQVSVQRTGRNDGSSTNGRGIISGSNNLLVSVEVANSYNYRTWDGKTSDGTNTAGGGNGDGILSRGNTHIDVHSHNNSDDGFDVWEGEKNYFYFVQSYENGKSPLGMPNGQTGDGNGFKLGRGDSTHYIYKSSAFDNKQTGFDQNGNTAPAVIIASESTNNGLSNYAQGSFLSNKAPALDLGVPVGGRRK